MVHNNVTGNHGLERTMHKLIKRVEKFLHMREYVRTFIRQCPFCQKMKELRTPIISSPFTTSSLEPMHTLNVDTIGPFPETEDGYKYIINIIDKFTRYVQLYPSKNVTVIDYANVLIEHII